MNKHLTTAVPTALLLLPEPFAAVASVMLLASVLSGIVLLGIIGRWVSRE